MFEKRRVKAWRDEQAAARAAFEKTDTVINLIRGAVSNRYEPEKDERFGARVGPDYNAGIISEQLRVSWGVRPQWGLLRADGDALKPVIQEPALIGTRLIKRTTKQLKVAVRIWIHSSEWKGSARRELSPVQAAPTFEDQWLELTLRLVAENVFQHEDAGLLWSPDSAMRETLRATIERQRRVSELISRGRSEHHVVLGVAVEASRDEIKLAWRRYAARHHPDRGGDNERFMRGRLAYEALLALTAELGL